MTFSQNFAKMEKLIGDEPANRISEILSNLGIESIDNQPSTLQLEVFEQDFFEENTHHFPVKDDEELVKHKDYVLSVALPGDVKIKIKFCYFEYNIVIEYNGVLYHWIKQDFDEPLSISTGGEILNINSGNDNFRISYAMSVEKDLFFVYLDCNTNYHMALDCTAESITNKVDNKQRPIEELDTMLDEIVSCVNNQYCYEELNYDDIKKPYVLMREAILKVANYIRQANGLSAIDWAEKKERVLTKTYNN